MTDKWHRIDDPENPAPRDGTHVLAWIETPTFDEDRNCMVTERGQVVAYWLFDQMVTFPWSGSVPQGQRFTHWQPLPQPPGESK